jgi:hypothetical protein
VKYLVIENKKGLIDLVTRKIDNEYYVLDLEKVIFILENIYK